MSVLANFEDTNIENQTPAPDQEKIIPIYICHPLQTVEDDSLATEQNVIQAELFKIDKQTIEIVKNPAKAKTDHVRKSKLNVLECKWDGYLQLMNGSNICMKDVYPKPVKKSSVKRCLRSNSKNVRPVI